MREVTGDLFEYDGVAIGHGVNCKGAMGAGIATQFRKRYPAMYDSYRVHCENGTLQPGRAFVYRSSDGRLICNIASQDFPGADARYDWLVAGISLAVADLIDAGVRELALPQIGCGIGGLDWEAVKVMLIMLEQGLLGFTGRGFEFIVYSLPTKETTQS